MGRRLSVLLPDLDQGLIINKLTIFLLGTIDLILVAEGGILRYVNAMRAVEVIEITLLEPGMQLHLVHRRFDRRVRNKTLDFLPREVTNPDSFGFAGFDEIFHRFVSL